MIGRSRARTLRMSARQAPAARQRRDVEAARTSLILLWRNPECARESRLDLANQRDTDNSIEACASDVGALYIADVLAPRHRVFVKATLSLGKIDMGRRRSRIGGDRNGENAVSEFISLID